MEPVVIVGSGLAGYTVAREFRRRDRKAALVVVTGDDGAYYSKPSLSNAFAHGQAPADLVLNTADQMAGSLKCEIVTRTRVSEIDAAGHAISWSTGGLSYSKLVLALGSTCLRPPIGGDASSEMVGINSLAEYALFRERVAGVRKVVILGAGLVGCEMANDLVLGGYQVHVLEMGPQLLPRLLGAEAAAVLAERLCEAGVEFTLGARATRIDRAARGYRVSLEEGVAIEADLVLGATGLVPQVALAHDAGLETRRAIVVDRFLRTSAPDIYALGDCAEVEGRWLPYTEPIRHAARALGATLAGTPTELAYPEMPVELKTPAHPMVITTSLPVVA